MESGDPQALAIKVEEPLNPITHFRGGFVRKCDCENLSWIGQASGDKIGDSMSNYACLARTSPSKDEQWQLGLHHSFSLLWVEVVEKGDILSWDFPLKCH